MENILIIAALDNTAGAGVLRDVKVCFDLGCHPIVIQTGLVIQNNQTVFNTIPLDIKTQGLILCDFKISAVKLGMLINKDIMCHVGDLLKNITAPIIADTPFVTSSGGVVSVAEDIDYFKNNIMPLVSLVTPNRYELNLLGGIEDMMLKGAKNILVKGGHDGGKDSIDTLLPKGKQYTAPRLAYDVRGTGCALATAIACFLARGLDLDDAISRAKDYVYQGLLHSYHKSQLTQKRFLG